MDRGYIRPFETTDRPVVGYAHNYPAGWDTGRHAHPRAQLLYATEGVMRVEAARHSYLVPPGLGLFVPPATDHAVRMDGPVAMRALFLHQAAAGHGPAGIAVIPVSALLRELILAACAEPVEWQRGGRGEHLAALAVDEIGRATQLPLSLPMPGDARLRRVTDALLAHPADARSFADHAAQSGASERTLARLFVRETGMGFLHWRRHVRLREALAALSAGATLARAAQIAGYAAGPAFGAAFRSAFGTTPGAMRRAPEPRPPAGVDLIHSQEDPMDTPKDPAPKVTGTTAAPNPKTGSSDAARGLGGHSKDASHDQGAPAQALKDGKPQA